MWKPRRQEQRVVPPSPSTRCWTGGRRGRQNRATAAPPTGRTYSACTGPARPTSASTSGRSTSTRPSSCPSHTPGLGPSQSSIWPTQYRYRRRRRALFITVEISCHRLFKPVVKGLTKYHLSQEPLQLERYFNESLVWCLFSKRNSHHIQQFFYHFKKLFLHRFIISPVCTTVHLTQDKVLHFQDIFRFRRFCLLCADLVYTESLLL